MNLSFALLFLGFDLLDLVFLSAPLELSGHLHFFGVHGLVDLFIGALDPVINIFLILKSVKYPAEITLMVPDPFIIILDKLMREYFIIAQIFLCIFNITFLRLDHFSKVSQIEIKSTDPFFVLNLINFADLDNPSHALPLFLGSHHPYFIITKVRM
jgi:hypothetical protein